MRVASESLARGRGGGGQVEGGKGVGTGAWSAVERGGGVGQVEGRGSGREPVTHF